MLQLIKITYSEVIFEFILFGVVVAALSFVGGLLHGFIWTKLLGRRVDPRCVPLKLINVFVAAKIQLKVKLSLVTVLD